MRNCEPKKRVELQCDAETHQELKRIAQQAGVSLNALVEVVCRWAAGTATVRKAKVSAFMQGEQLIFEVDFHASIKPEAN